MRLTWSALVFTLGLGVGGLGCVPVPPGTTTDTTSDGTGCEPGSMGCVCMEDNSCDDGLICASNECIPDDSAGTSTGSVATTSSTSTTTEPGTGTGTTTTSGSTTAQPACDAGNGVSNNPDCETGLYCSSEGECVDCSGLVGDDSCASVDVNTPVCDPASGTCVECLEGQAEACSGDTPVCDGEAMTCQPCTSNSQCQSGACVLDTGACFPADSVIWVNRLGANCLEATGSNDKPFCEIADAVDSIIDTDPRLIRVKPSATYTKQIDVSSGLTIAIMRESDETDPIVLQVANEDSVQIAQNAKVYIEDLSIRGEGPTTAAGVVCNSALISLTRSEIVDKRGTGAISNDCELMIDGSRLYNDLGGGIRATSGAVTIRNSIIGNNGSGGAMVSGLTLEGSVAVDIVYTTIAFNFAFGPQALVCADTADGTIRNSIVFGSGDQNSVECGALEFTTSAVDSNDLMGSMNKFFSPDQLQLGWFVDVLGGDFHLTGNGAEFNGVAVWSDGDPMIDFDGDMRPAVDSSPDFAGADLP